MIEVKNLSRVRGDGYAVADVSFKLVNGKRYGVLGAPGAGKTTLLELLAGVLAPSGGAVRINGFDMQKEPLQAKRCIGYLPYSLPVYDHLTVYEDFLFTAEARGLAGLRATRRVHEVLEMTGLDELRDRLMGELSTLQCLKLGLAQTLLGSGDILLLDDPLDGIDPLQKKELREFILSIGEGKTVIMSLSDPDEALELCEHLLVLQAGKLVLNAPLDELPPREELAALCASDADTAARKGTRAERDGEYELIDADGEDA